MDNKFGKVSLMKKFKMMFPLDEKRKVSDVDNAYINFCVSYVNQLKESLEFQQIEVSKDGKKYIQMSINMGRSTARRVEKDYVLKNKARLNANEYAVIIPPERKDDK